MRGWLRPGGLLLVGLPNFASPIARLGGVHWAGLRPSEHIWHFTPAALRRLVREAGFAPLVWRTRMLTYRPASTAEWVKWGLRRALEAAGGADNLLLVARAGTAR